MTAPTYDLGELHGGLRLPAHKSESTALPIQTAPLPAQLVLPVVQHSGDPARPVVGIGEQVLKGQLIAEAQGPLGAPVHASSSGKIVAIEPRPVHRRFGAAAPCIVIECDGEDRAVESGAAPVSVEGLTAQDLLSRIVHGGIVGLGGAVFPTAHKLLQATSCNLEYLIVNGVECEPYISCDDVLMREHSREAVSGARILMRALGIDTCYIAVESDKPEASRQLGLAIGELGDEGMALKQVPTIYPSGGEDQLVQLVANREVPSTGLPTDVGCLVQNIGTAVAVHDWIVGGEPLISRVTTVTGDGVRRPMNVRARVGTSVADIIAFAGGYTERASQLIIGGPMTGKSVTTDLVPVVKATNCILVLSGIAGNGKAMPCIRCGECAAVCPIRLLPQQLHWYARADREDRLHDHGLLDCIECGCCDLVCPSQIPLTAGFRSAKLRIRELQDEKTRAERARTRFEARSARLHREQLARDEELTRQKAAARKAGPEAIAAILERRHERGEDN